MREIIIIEIKIILLSFVIGNFLTDACAEQKTNEIMGGIIIIRNCPKDMMKNLRFMPSSMEGGGWAEISKDKRRIRIDFKSFTEDDINKFNYLGNETEPRIKVVLYHGDFVFLVRSTKVTSEPAPETEKSVELNI